MKTSDLAKRLKQAVKELKGARLEMDDLWRLARLAENEADHYDDETYTVLAEKLRKIIMKGGVR
jgi:septation ring formation regulator EzrA